MLIDIRESPPELVRRLVTLYPGAAGLRAEALGRKLARQSDSYWADLVRHTSRTKTALSPVGIEAGARLMLHGYLSTLAVLHVLFDAEFKNIKGERYFL